MDPETDILFREKDCTDFSSLVLISRLTAFQYKEYDIRMKKYITVSSA